MEKESEKICNSRDHHHEMCAHFSETSAICQPELVLTGAGAARLLSCFWLHCLSLIAVW